MDYRDHVEIDSKYFRPTDVNILLGDATKARKVLGWVPRVGFDELVDMMVKADLELAKKEETLRVAGYERSNNVR
jgi:GDPmannose 4,6-dehydratase